MNIDQIRSTVRGIVARVARRDPAQIGDNVSLVDDLQLDSLSLLEIGVDPDYEFKLGVPKEAMRGLDSVQQVSEFVARHSG